MDFASDDGTDGTAAAELDICDLELNENDLEDEDIEIEDSSRKGSSSLNIAVKIQSKAAEFLAYVKDICKTTEIAIGRIVIEVDSLFKLYNDFLKTKLFELSDGDAVQKSDMESLFSLLDQQSLFEGVQTLYKREKYKKEKWSALIPKKVVLEWKRIVLHGRVREVPLHFGYYIDFLAQLEAVLQCDDILECLDSQKNVSASHLNSIIDGQSYQSHEVALKYPGALAFVFYVDDVNPGDTLSSYQISFRNYLWTLANIPPELRSSIRAINMFAIAKTEVAKMCNNKAFLSNFTLAMNRLSSDEGVTFIIKGKPRVFHGFCLCGVGDYPASGNIGGFKESSSKAKRPCRQCMILQPELSWKYDESEVVLRNKDSHERHLQALEGCEQVQQVDVEEEEEDVATAEENPSVFYGVNCRSPLLDLNYFDVTVSLPQDIMHLFLEGILSTGCRLLLHHAVRDRKLSLAAVNSFLINHDYGRFKSDKPSKIKPEHLNNGLRQTSSQILMLSFIVPFIVKGHCDRVKLNNFVLLLMIFGVCLSRQVTLDHALLIRNMVKDYLPQFNSLYPGSFVSKHHFLIHLPSQLVAFGPLPETWAMRFESYHAQLSRLHSILHNAKNSIFSLITRVCSKQALLLHLHKSNFLTGSVIEMKTLKINIPLADVPFKECILSCVRGISEESTVSELSSLKWYGSNLERESFINIQEDSFAVVTNIYAVNKEYVLIYRKLKTMCFSVDLNAFEVECPNVSSFAAMNISKNYNLSPEMHFKFEGREYIVMRQNSSPKYHLLRA